MRLIDQTVGRREIEFVLGAQRRVVTQTNQDPIGVAESDSCRLAFFPTKPQTPVVVRVHVAGRDLVLRDVPARAILEAIGIARSAYYGFRVELPFSIEAYCTHVPTDRHLISCIEYGRARLSGPRAMCNAAIQRGIRIAVQGIDSRRALLEKRLRLEIQTSHVRVDIGRVPTNEHEVLILIGRLHSYIESQIPRFRILEHTSLLGIDALADVQLSVDGPVFPRATVEFEFSLENFFRHEHPIRQTSFVVCWTVGNLPEAVHYRVPDTECSDQHGDGHDVVLSGTGWRRHLNFGDHLIHVFVLELLPGLRVTAT